MWGIVETLGLKDGLTEFTEQLNKDAKVTIANQQWAKDRGIDVAQLDAWEKDLHKQKDDLSKRTIGAAVDALAKDETLAHLLEIRPVSNENDGDYEDESDVDWDDDDDISLSSGPTASRRPTAHFDLWAVREPLGGEKTSQSLITKTTPPPSSVSTTDAGPEAQSGDSHAEDSKVKPLQRRLQAAGLPNSVAVSVEQATASTSAASKSPALAAAEVAPPGTTGAAAPPVLQGADVPAQEARVPATGSTAPRERTSRGQTRSERVRQLEAELSSAIEQSSVLEAQLAAAKAHGAELMSRWTEISTVSDEALHQAEEARQEVSQLRQALEQKEQLLSTLQAEHADMAADRSRLEAEKAELEGCIEEKVRLEVGENKKELLAEVDYLKKANEAKERRISGLAEEKSNLEKRALGRDADAAQAADREVMMSAHTAIAKAFGDVSTGSPALRLVDEPLLRFTAVLFKQPMVRRIFFAVTAVMWTFALRTAVEPGTGHHIVV